MRYGKMIPSMIIFMILLSPAFGQEESKSRLEGELQNLKKENAILQRKNDELHNELARLNGEKDRLQNTINELKTSNGSLEKTVSTLNGKVDDLDKQMIDLKDKLKISKQYGRGWRGRAMILAGLAGLELVVFLGLILFSKPRSEETRVDGVNVCPACGWEISPNEVQCPNPDCRIVLR